jgi:hypothetical protein
MNNQRTQKILDWYKSEIERDSVELENEKKRFISKMKKTSKDKILEELKPKKYTLWQRLKKVLMGI